MKKTRESDDVSRQILDCLEADKFASEMDEVLMDISELNPETCPPDKRYMMAGREAWVYEHGNICELVFVRTD